MTLKVLYLNPLNDYIARVKETKPEDFELVILPDGTSTRLMCEEAATADFIISGIDIPEEVFRAATRARFIQYMSSGYGQLPLPVLNSLGVPVAQMKTHSISVAEHAVTLMLSVLRRVPEAIDLLHEGKWRQDLNEASYSELYGKTVGIVGFGNIGRWVGKIVSQGFGSNVIFYDRGEIPLTISELIPATPTTLNELMSTADVICVSVPFNAGSGKLIGQEELSRMKPSAVLVNVGRGEVIDEAALIAALQQGEIAGAGLDVYESEPLDLSSELLKLPNVVCTPHMAGAGRDNIERRIETVWSNFARVLQGSTPVGIITDPANNSTP